MAEVVQIKTEFDGKQAVGGLIQIEKEAKKGGKSLAQMQADAEELREQLESTASGTKEFERLRKEVVKADSEIQTLSKTMEGMDAEGKAGELGKVAGGIGSIATASALAFGNNEDAEAFFETFATGLAVTEAFKGGIEAASGVMRLFQLGVIQDTAAKIANTVATIGMTIATGALNVAVGVATAAQWLWNAAMTANPIGLIVVGVAALAAGVLYAVGALDGIIDGFTEWGKAILIMLPPIWLLVEAYDALFGEEAKKQEQIKKGIRDEAKARDQRINDINRVRKAEKKAHEDRQKAYDVYIDTLEAAGESSFKARLSQLKDILAEKEAVLESSNAKLQSYIDYYMNVAALRGQSTDDFKAQMKRQGVDFDKLQARFKKAQQDQVNGVQYAQNEITRLTREHNKELADEAKAKQDELDKLADDALKRQREIFKQLDDLEVQDDPVAKAMLDFERKTEFLNEALPEENALRIAFEKELYKQLDEIEEERLKKLEEEREKLRELEEEDLQRRIDAIRALDDVEAERDPVAKAMLDFERKIETLDATIPEENALIVAYEQQLIDELALLDQEAKDAEVDRAKEAAEEIEKIRNEKIEAAKNGIESIANVSNIVEELQVAQAGDNEEKKERIRKASFKRTKALQLSLAIVDGFKAVTSSLALSPIALGPVPNPAGIASLAFAVTTSAANIAKIATSKYSGGGAAPVSSPSLSGASGSVGGGSINSAASTVPSGGADFNLDSSPQVSSGSDPQSSGQSQTGSGEIKVRAVVVESDVTNSQLAVGAINSQASFN